MPPRGRRQRLRAQVPALHPVQRPAHRLRCLRRRVPVERRQARVPRARSGPSQARQRLRAQVQALRQLQRQAHRLRHLRRGLQAERVQARVPQGATAAAAHLGLTGHRRQRPAAAMHPIQPLFVDVQLLDCSI